MKLGSLCSGAGGLDMAVEQVFGAETVWHCEVDAAASKVLAHHWPGVPNHGDLTNTEWSQVETVDIMCAGWPCQPFSLAGKRKGAEDERAIWPYVAGAIRVLRPRIVCLENVSAVVGSGELERVANSLTPLGYDLRWTCLRASDVGAPHRRERLFIVAHADTVGDRRNRITGQAISSAPASGTVDSGASAVSGDGPVNLLPTPCAQQSGNTPENHLAKKPGRKVVTDLAILVENGLIASGGELLPTPRTSDTNGAGTHGNGGMDLRTAVTELGVSNAASEGRPGEVLRDMRDSVNPQEVQQWPAGRSERLSEADPLWPSMCELQGDSSGGQPQVAGTQDQAEGSLRGLRNHREATYSSQGQESSQQPSDESGGAVQQLPSEVALAGGPRVSAGSYAQWGRYAAAIKKWEQVLGRPAPNPTEPNRNGNPRLNPEFSSWMMGWPAGWVTDVPGISRNDALRIIGNGVVPAQAAAALSWLLSLEVAA